MTFAEDKGIVGQQWRGSLLGASCQTTIFDANAVFTHRAHRPRCGLPRSHVFVGAASRRWSTAQSIAARVQVSLHPTAPGVTFARPGGRAQEERRLGNVSADAATVPIFSRLGGFSARDRTRGLVSIQVVAASIARPLLSVRGGRYTVHRFSDRMARGLLSRSGVRAG